MSKPEQNYPQELRDLAERLLGGPFDEFSFVIKPSVFTTDPNAATVQEREPIIDGVSERCVYKQSVIDFSGVAATDSKGKITWRFRDFISPCGLDIGDLDRPLSFVATPHSDSPVYLTTKPNRGFFVPPDDISIEVFTWDKSGSPAPSIGFSWRFRVPYFPRPL